MNKILNIIYPSVKQDILWHRIVRVLGWIISVSTIIFFPLTFIVYFGIVQRAIFYIVYGTNKERWAGNEYTYTFFVNPKAKKVIYIILATFFIFLTVSIVSRVMDDVSKYKNTKSTNTKELSKEEISDRLALKSAVQYLAVDMEDFNGAIRASDDFIKKYGDDVDVWVHRGMSYYKLHDCTNATASLKHAVEIGTSSEYVSIEDVNDLYTSMFTQPLSWCE